MRLIGFIFVIIIIFWSSYWWIVTQKIENSITSWFYQNHSNQDLSFNTITTAGYPNRADISIKKFSYHNFDSDLSISADLIQFLSLIYDKSHLISIIKPPIEIKLKKSHLKILGPAIKSSLKIGSDKKLIELISEGQNLKLEDKKNNVWTLKKILFATEKLDKKNPEAFRSHLSINNIAIPTNYFNLGTTHSLLSKEIKTLSISSEIYLTKNLNDIPEFDKKIKATDFTVNIVWDSIDLGIDGNFELSDKAILTGSFKFKLGDWQNALTSIENKSILDEKSYKKINAALTFLASQTSLNRYDLTFPLTVKDNVIFLGPIKMGKINLDY